MEQATFKESNRLLDSFTHGPPIQHQTQRSAKWPIHLSQTRLQTCTSALNDIALVKNPIIPWNLGSKLNSQWFCANNPSQTYLRSRNARETTPFPTVSQRAPANASFMPITCVENLKPKSAGSVRNPATDSLHARIVCFEQSNSWQNLRITTCGIFCVGWSFVSSVHWLFRWGCCYNWHSSSCTCLLPNNRISCHAQCTLGKG